MDPTSGKRESQTHKPSAPGPHSIPKIVAGKPAASRTHTTNCRHLVPTNGARFNRTKGNFQVGAGNGSGRAVSATCRTCPVAMLALSSAVASERQRSGRARLRLISFFFLSGFSVVYSSTGAHSARIDVTRCYGPSGRIEMQLSQFCGRVSSSPPSASLVS